MHWHQGDDRVLPNNGTTHTTIPITKFKIRNHFDASTKPFFSLKSRWAHNSRLLPYITQNMMK